MSPAEAKIPLYASENTARVLRNVFRYIFEADYKYGGLAQVELRPLDGPLSFLARRSLPLPVLHGDAPIEAFRFGTAAYLTDFSAVPEESLEQLAGIWTSCFSMPCGIILIPRIRRLRIR